jgi:iron complex outermembrane receptor protein
MVGGYIQSSPGVRDPQFTAEEGNQFTANLTKLFETGKINVFARMTDDHGQWILPQALFTGNDEGDFAQLGNATRFRELQTDAAGDTEIFDFGNGRGWEGLVSGGSAEFDLGGGFTIRDQFTFMDGDADTYGFVPDGSPVTVGAVSAVTGQPVTFTINGETTTLADDAFVQNYRHWVVQKDLEAVINDLSLNKVFGESHDVTLGYYRASWSSDDFWLLGGAVAVQNVANGAPLDPPRTSLTQVERSVTRSDSSHRATLAQRRSTSRIPGASRTSSVSTSASVTRNWKSTMSSTPDPASRTARSTSRHT